jgi:hypothetical protein
LEEIETGIQQYHNKHRPGQVRSGFKTAGCFPGGCFDDTCTTRGDDHKEIKKHGQGNDHDKGISDYHPPWRESVIRHTRIFIPVDSMPFAPTQKEARSTMNV